MATATKTEQTYDEGRLVGTVEKNGAEQIRVRLTEYKGFQLLDVRQFYLADGGEFKPTGKGFTIRRELAGDLRQVLQEAEEIISAEAN